MNDWLLKMALIYAEVISLHWVLFTSRTSANLKGKVVNYLQRVYYLMYSRTESEKVWCESERKLRPAGYLFALRQRAFLLLLSIMFLLLLSDQAQRQTERLWKDVRLPGVHWEQREVDQPLLFVNTEDKNRKSCRLKVAWWQHWFYKWLLSKAAPGEILCKDTP